MKIKLITGISLILIVLAVSCQNDEQVEYNRYYTGGNQLYESHCQNCHGDKGQGLQAFIPPLTDSAYLKSNKANLACYLKNGLKTKITVHNKTFEGEMPAANLSPIEIAKVLTYITNSFGNKMGVINLKQVEGDLEKCH